MAICVMIFLLVLMMPLEAASQDNEEVEYNDDSFSNSGSTYFPDGTACFFRGAPKPHGHVFKIDRCTECRCNNGTISCIIESCEKDPRCQSAESIVEEGECCPHCPYSTPARSCSLRGTSVPHKHSVYLDSCTLCTCEDHGNMHCQIESCPSDLGCDVSQIILVSEECCPLCPYELVVKRVRISYDNEFTLDESSSNKIRFSLHVAVKEEMSSKTVRGEQMWRLKAWMSANKDGSGRRMSLQPNIFNEEDAAKPFLKRNLENFKWFGLEFRIEPGEESCGNYFCVRFDQGRDPRAMYDLSFTFRPHNNKKKKLVHCLAFSNCND